MRPTTVEYLDENQLVWDEPPMSKREIANLARERWLRVVAALKERPGEWAIVARKPTRQHLNTGSVVERLGPDFQVASRVVDGEGRLYARYNPATETEGA